MMVKRIFLIPNWEKNKHLDQFLNDEGHICLNSDKWFLEYVDGTIETEVWRICEKVQSCEKGIE